MFKVNELKCLITDVDGVLSDGYLHLSNNGDEFKSFHVHDGMGLKLLMHAGIQVAVITTSENNIIDTRMNQLGIEHYYSGFIDKCAAYKDLKKKLNLQDNNFAYIGDDLPDIPVMLQVGLKLTVADAQPEVKEIADYISKAKGGHGAVREICNIIISKLKLKQQAIEKYLNG